MIRGMHGRWSRRRRLRHRFITLPWNQLSAAVGRCGTLNILKIRTRTTNDADYQSDSFQCAGGDAVGAAASRHRRDGVPDYGRVGNLSYFRCRVYLLHRQEPEWTDAGTGAGVANPQHGVSAFEQRYGSLCGKCTAQKQHPQLYAVDGGDSSAGSDLPDVQGAGGV